MDTQYLNNTKSDSRKIRAMNIKIKCGTTSKELSNVTWSPKEVYLKFRGNDYRKIQNIEISANIKFRKKPKLQYQNFTSKNAILS